MNTQPLEPARLIALTGPEVEMVRSLLISKMREDASAAKRIMARSTGDNADFDQTNAASRQVSADLCQQILDKLPYATNHEQPNNNTASSTVN